MKHDETMSAVLGCSVSGFYKWKKQNHPIINLLKKYFTKEDLEEYIKTGEITKQERFNELLEIEKRYQKIQEIIKGDDAITLAAE